MIKNYKMEDVLHHQNIPARILVQQIKGTNCYVAPHWHRDVEINLQLVGSTIFTVNGLKKELKPGEFNIINSGVIHSGDSFKLSEESELITLQLDYDFFLRYYKDLPQYVFDLEVNQDVESKNVMNRIRDLIIEVAILYEEKSFFYEMKVSAIIYSISALLLEFCLKKNELYLDHTYTNKVLQMQEAIEYMNQNYHRPISLAEMANHMNMAPTYFSRKFKQITGTTFQECLIKCRLQKARIDLENTALSITEIALSNGFPNVKSFIEYYKRYYQITPQKYRSDKR